MKFTLTGWKATAFLSVFMIGLLSVLMDTVFIAHAFAQAVVNPDLDFFAQVSQFVASYGGMTPMVKISGYILLVIAITKTSFVAPLWDKLPAVVKTLVAPLLGLIGAILTQGSSLTWASAFAFVTAGTGAVFIHEILDGVKAIPGLGQLYISIIDMAEKVLFKPQA